MKKLIPIFLFFTLTGFMTFSNAQQAGAGYKIVNRIHLDGEGGWDYLTVDDASGRIFVSHGTVVQVADEKDGHLIGVIADTRGVHGITLAHDLNKIFISNGRDTSVTVADLNTLAFIQKIRVTGQNPDAIMYDIFSHRVFTFNGRSSNANVIDAKNNQVVGTIKLDGKPEFAVNDGNGKIFVNIEDKSEISQINSMTMKVEQTWSIAPGEEPSGLAIDNINHRLFSVCGNKMMVVVDALSGKVISTLPIGGGVDGVIFDPGLKQACSSNGEGTITVVSQLNANEYKVLANVPTQAGARTIALDPKTHHLFTPTAEFAPASGQAERRPAPKPGTFTVIDLAPDK